jgi:hypothetical protein
MVALHKNAEKYEFFCSEAELSNFCNATVRMPSMRVLYTLRLRQTEKI